MDAVGHDGGHEQARRWGLVVVVFACACAVLVACLLVYSAYMNRLLYNERLDQMKGVTVQLFQGLEDNIDDRWADVEVRSGRLLSQHPHTVAELCAYIAQQDEIIDASAKNEAGIIAVDDKGCFYSAQGQGGPLRDMDVLVGQPERISYISNDTMSAKTCMVLLSMLAEPVVLDDGTRILYYGSRLPIEQLSPYFECKAYEGTSSVYLLGTDGTKIFFDGSGELIHGFNAFSVLKQMHYSHGSTFDDALRALNETGTAYSNAVLEGTEYYYALRRIEGTEWTVLFLVPSSSVATNTVHLVELNTNTMLVFAASRTNPAILLGVFEARSCDSVGPAIMIHARIRHGFASRGTAREVDQGCGGGHLRRRQDFELPALLRRVQRRLGVPRRQARARRDRRAGGRARAARGARRHHRRP